MVETSTVDTQIGKVRQAGQQAVDFAKSGAGLEQMLRQSVSERLAASPLNQQRDRAAANVLTSAPRARESVLQTVQAGQAGQPGGAILSPTQQASIIASKR